MRYSALIHLLEEKYNGIEDWSAHSHEVTKIIIKDFYSLAKENGIEFIVAGIDSESAKMLKELGTEEIKTVDISVDLSMQANRNWPYDSHPSLSANKKYAEKLESFLKDVIFKEPTWNRT